MFLDTYNVCGISLCNQILVEENRMKNCPFCGCANSLQAKELRYPLIDRVYSYVYCPSCGSKGPVMDTPVAAEKAWDMRAFTINIKPEEK